MRYADGTDVRCGDIVAYSGGEAVVVADADLLCCEPEHLQAFAEFYAGCVSNPARDASGPAVSGGLLLIPGRSLVAVFKSEPEITLIRRPDAPTGTKVVVETRGDWVGLRLEKD